MSNGQPSNRAIKEWMEDIERGRIALPRFQRGFVWDDKTISDLILAIIKEKPVGALLAINYHKNCRTFRPLAIRGAKHLFNEKKYEDDGGMMILDGQQRLTAIWSALNNVFSTGENDKNKRREFFMEIDLDKIDSKEQEFISNVVCEKIDDNDKNKENQNEYLFEKKKIPVKLLHKDQKHNIREWIKAACDDQDLSEKVSQRILDCNIDFNQRDISFYTLSDEMEAGEMIETFVRINTSSSKMKAFDIAVAYIEDLNIKGGEEKRFRNKIEEMNIEPGRIERFFPSDENTSEIGELILKIACLLTKVKGDGKPLVPTQRNYVRREVLSTVLGRWEKIVRSIDKTLGFLERESIYDEKRLPSEVPLRVLPALFAGVPEKISPDKKGQIDRLIRSYLWRSFVTERYDSAAESRLHQDYMKLHESIERILQGDSYVRCSAPVFNGKIPNLAMLSDLKNPLKSPKSKNKLPRALLILSLKKGAKDLASDEEVDFSNIQSRQYHHLFPKKMLEKEGRRTDEIDHPLNFVLIREDSNKIIAAKKPRDYLFQRQVGSTKEGDIRKRVESLEIPYDELNVETGKGRKYEKFIEKRAELFLNALRDLCDGKS